MNYGFGMVNNTPSRLENEHINLGIAIDIEKKDGSRNLLVPNIKGAEAMNFAQFFDAYNETGKKARDGKLEIADFQGTTISLTNPGTIGTVASNPRLMSGQSRDHRDRCDRISGRISSNDRRQRFRNSASAKSSRSPAPTIIASFRVPKAGSFWRKIHEFLIGKHGFYDEVFNDLGINYPPMRWAEDDNPSLLGGDRFSEQAEKQANVLQLDQCLSIRGHLLADIDPLNMTPHHADELDLENFGLTIWDLDREFITGGMHGEKTATLRRILEILRRLTPEKSASNIATSRARMRRTGSDSRSASSSSIPFRSTPI